MKIMFLPAAAMLSFPLLTNAVESDPVIVTATRTAQTADETLASVTVIKRDDIERQQVKTVDQLLKGVPGLHVTNSGGPGKATSIFIRGTESDHTLILVDGIKVGSATLGSTALHNIPVELIERIEIVRGPRSSLYGSEAIGGVIQIFTRQGSGDNKSYFRAGGGSYNTYSGSAGISGGGKNNWYNVNINMLDTDGFNACNGKPSPGGAGCFTIEPDKDGYSNLAGSLRTVYQFENNTKVDLRYFHTTSETEYDGSFVNESESVQSVAAGSIGFMPTRDWQSDIMVGRSKDTADNFKDGTHQTTFETVRDTASWQNDISLTQEQILTIGMDYQDDNVSSTTDYLVKSRDNKGVFAQYQWDFNTHKLQLSLRGDDIERLAHHGSGSVAWGYKLDNQLRITMSYGTAYKAPTFNELYYPGFGNAGLQPEESESLEFGLRRKTDNINWSVALYQTRVNNLIAYDAAIPAPANIDKAEITGLETATTISYQGWQFNASFTLLDPENQSSGSTQGNVLPRRAKQSLRVDADKTSGQYSLGATLLADGRRYDDLANTRELDGYSTLSLRTTYSFDKDWKLEANIENVLDKEYETASYFNQPERSFYMSVLYKH